MNDRSLICRRPVTVTVTVTVKSRSELIATDAVGAVTFLVSLSHDVRHVPTPAADTSRRVQCVTCRRVAQLQRVNTLWVTCSFPLQGKI